MNCGLLGEKLGHSYSPAIHALLGSAPYGLFEKSEAELPDFQAAYETYGDTIHFMMVDLTDGYQETVEKAKSFIADAGYTFPVYFDTESEAAIAYNATSIPATYFIDAEGNLVVYARGMLDAANLQKGIDMLLETTE